MNKHKPLVLIGGGGHASVLADILLGQGRDIVAVISPDDLSSRAVFTGLVHLTQDEEVKRFSPESVHLVNGIGMLPRSMLRQRVNQQFLELGYQFETVIASDAHVSRFATIHSGVQILSGARVQTGAVIGEYTIVNSAALVEHDCQIGAYNHIAPRATLCGGISSEELVFIGAGAVICPGVSLGRKCIVGAGVTIRSDVLAGITAVTEVKAR
ncbi:acetyltransferase [Vibrio cholerae]|uniref:acetyltransferase n=1 Tax=Vibrio cholerae TaxID=666 RepID=UPI000E0A962B|nr:acetyltransferase [Vibrio cholerae]EGR1307544.1 acetyltransferase [Vibrio cholerae]MDV2318759.1 acetyltransferase [Vibrio cholerae]NOE77948.1 shikimate dehydrogenase [Vibrio cholerae]TXY59327.1 acetyltransferase [Vibrio cholerae]BCN16862.1 putative acetyltransferase [Vibrio cholerae]